MIGVIVLIHAVLLTTSLIFGWYIFASIIAFFGVIFMGVSASDLLTKKSGSLDLSEDVHDITLHQTVGYLTHPATLVGTIWIGVYLLLVSLYGSWMAPTWMVMLVLMTLVMVVGVSLLLSHQQGWYHLTASQVTSILFTTILHWFAAFILNSIFALVAIFSQEWLPIEVLGVLVILGFSGVFLIMSQWYTLMSEQWMSLALLILLTVFGWYSLVFGGVFWFFAGVFTLLIASLCCLYIPYITWIPSRLSPTFREIGFYFSLLLFVCAPTGAVIFPILFWHYIILSVSAIVIIATLFYQFRLLFTWGLVVVGYFLMIALILLHSSLRGQDLSFTLFLLTVGSYGILGYPLTPRWSTAERGILSMMILIFYMVLSLVFALIRHGFYLIGFAWLFLTFGILLLITFRDIRTYFGTYDFSKIPLLIRSRPR